jgi:UDP-glucose 4-epimerase
VKALVTGGAGFIGSHLAERLVELGHRVTVLDNLSQGNKLTQATLERVELVVGDVRDQETVERCASGCDVIFHLAALLGVDLVADNPVETMETEVLGMRHVCRAAIEGGARVVYASTSGVYGKMAVSEAVSEDVHVSPRSSYSIAKRFNEMYLAAQHQEKGLESASLRYFNAYGPRQDSRMVTPRFFAQALAGQPLTVYGSGGQTRDFTYIDDIVKATVLAAGKVRGCRVFNVSNSREYSIKELAEKIAALTGSASPVALVEAPPERYDFEVERRFGCSDKLREAVGFAPDTPLDEGLARIYRSLLEGKDGGER